MKYPRLLLLEYLRFLLFTFLLIVHVIIVLIVARECVQITRKHFKSYNDAVQEGYVGKIKFISPDFPTNTFNIKVRYDSDSTEIWIKCEFRGEFNFGNRVLESIDNLEVQQYMIRYFKLKKRKVRFNKIGGEEYIGIDGENKMLFYYSK